MSGALPYQKAKELLRLHIEKAAPGAKVRMVGRDKAGPLLHGIAVIEVDEKSATERKGELMILMQDALEKRGWNISIGGGTESAKPGIVQLDCVAEKWGETEAAPWLKP